MSHIARKLHLAELARHIANAEANQDHVFGHQVNPKRE